MFEELKEIVEEAREEMDAQKFMELQNAGKYMAYDLTNQLDAIGDKLRTYEDGDEAAIVLYSMLNEGIGTISSLIPRDALEQFLNSVMPAN